MKYSGRYGFASEDIAGEQFDRDYVLLNLATGHYYAIGGAGSVFLEGLLNGFDIADIVAALAANGGGDRVAEAERFLDELISNRLIGKDETQPARPLPRDWMARLRSAGEPFSLQVFDDLAELITADPIHEADETLGWPAPRGA